MDNFIEAVTMLPVLILHVTMFVENNQSCRELARVGIAQSIVSSLYHVASIRFAHHTRLLDLLLFMDKMGILLVTYCGHSMIVKRSFAQKLALIPAVVLCKEEESIALYVYISMVNADFGKKSRSPSLLFILDTIAAIMFFFGIPGIMHLLLCPAFSLWYEVLENKIH